MILHRVRDGQRLSAIAQHHGVATRDIVKANPHKQGLKLATGEIVFSSLAAGETLRVPSRLGAVAQLPAYASCYRDGIDYTYQSSDGMCHKLPTSTLPANRPAIIAPNCQNGGVWNGKDGTCTIPIGGLDMSGGLPAAAPPTATPAATTTGFSMDSVTTWLAPTSHKVIAGVGALAVVGGLFWLLEPASSRRGDDA
jgi:hypothetical protein